MIVHLSIARVLVPVYGSLHRTLHAPVCQQVLFLSLLCLDSLLMMWTFSICVARVAKLVKGPLHTPFIASLCLPANILLFNLCNSFCHFTLFHMINCNVSLYAVFQSYIYYAGYDSVRSVSCGCIRGGFPTIVSPGCTRERAPVWLMMTIICYIMAWCHLWLAIFTIMWGRPVTSLVLFMSGFFVVLPTLRLDMNGTRGDTESTMTFHV